MTNSTNTHIIILNSSKELVFDSFINDITLWWPREYTWGTDVVSEMLIEPKLGGRLIEKSNDGNEFDWGLINDWDKPNFFSFYWKISPTRVPEPNQKKCSIVTIRFEHRESNETQLSLRHSHFINHGEGYKEYEIGLNSNEGWPYILQKFRNYFQLKK